MSMFIEIGGHNTTLLCNSDNVDVEAVSNYVMALGRTHPRAIAVRYWHETYVPSRYFDAPEYVEVMQGVARSFMGGG